MKEQIDYSNKAEVEQVLKDTWWFKKRISKFAKRYLTPTTNECQAFLIKAEVQVVFDDGDWRLVRVTGAGYNLSYFDTIKGIPQEDLELALLAACAWVILDKGDKCSD